MNRLDFALVNAKENVRRGALKVMTRKHRGVDGLVVTIGLCLIALVLIITFKGSLESFITTLVAKLTTKAEGILGA